MCYQFFSFAEGSSAKPQPSLQEKSGRSIEGERERIGRVGGGGGGGGGVLVLYQFVSPLPLQPRHFAHSPELSDRCCSCATDPGPEYAKFMYNMHDPLLIRHAMFLGKADITCVILCCRDFSA